MDSYSLTHVADDVFLHDCPTHRATERSATALGLAHLAEIEVRGLYAAAGYSSMHAYCTGRLCYSDDEAYVRLRVARIGRRVPALFVALASGRIHLTAALKLAPKLTRQNAEELLAAATGKSKGEVEQVLAEHFPQLDVPTSVVPVSQRGAEPVVDPSCRDERDEAGPELVPEPVVSSPELPETAPTPRTKAVPLAPGRFALTVTIDQDVHDLLNRAQDLLSHRVPRGDVQQVLRRALQALVRELERRKFAATDRPRTTRKDAKVGKRCIPAHVRREVEKRDGGRCTFVSDDGHRCEATAFLELDHIEPVALGGTATVDGVRQLCRTHNQYEAERRFGREFMRDKREAARRASAERREAKSRVRPVPTHNGHPEGWPCA
jgi:hypothetical protein